jgi:hypothetical protein
MPSFPLNYPTNSRLQPKSIQFTNKTLSSQFRSPYSGQTQTYRYGGQWFELNVTLAPLFQADAEEMTGFLNALAGNSGTFLFKLPSKFLTAATVQLTTTTTGNDFTVNSGTVSVGKYGYTSNYTPNRLVQFTTATSLFPKLKPSQGGYYVDNSSGVKMRLASSDVSYSVDEMMIHGIVIPMIEAI